MAVFKCKLTYAGLPVVAQLVAMVAGAEGTTGGMLTMMGAPSIVLLTAIHNLHLNACR